MRKLFLDLPISLLSLSTFKALWTADTVLWPPQVAPLFPLSTSWALPSSIHHFPGGLCQTPPPLAKALMLRTLTPGSTSRHRPSWVGVGPKKGKGG